MKNKFVERRVRKREGGSNLLFFLSGFVALAFLATLYIWQRMETVGLVKEIGILEAKTNEIEKTKAHLATEVLRLSSPQEICPRAEEILGLSTTDLDRQFAMADLGRRLSLGDKWQRFLADLKQYGQQAWKSVEPEALAQGKSE